MWNWPRVLPTPFTWQIGDPNTLAEMTGITVVADFRRRDVAAGGQGAPLLPVFHDQVFRSDAEDRVIANLGGIANITILQRDATVSGFDTGPANRLLDAWMALRRHPAAAASG
jgi:anhydro-N-acetylmuramic acid kinase